MSSESKTMESISETTQFQYSWTVWYFDPRNATWDLSNYKRLPPFNTPQQFWSIVSSIPKEAIECGYFFFLREGFRPIWEVPENIDGGSFSKKVNTAQIKEIFVELACYCMAGKDGLFVDRKDTLVGFSTSPKGPNNVVKIWNTTTSANDLKLLNTAIPKFPIVEVVYTPWRSRKVTSSST